MLRWIIFIIGCVFLLGALVALVGGSGMEWIQLAVPGLILAGGVLFERWRYQPRMRGRPGPHWQPTGERFVDPESGIPMEVYFDPASGKRLYVETDGDNGE